MGGRPLLVYAPSFFTSRLIIIRCQLSAADSLTVYHPLFFFAILQPLEVFIDSTKLTLHGLIQYFVKLSEKEKNRKLVDLLDTLEFNQVVIFVSKPQRAVELNRLLEEVNFPVMCIHGQMKQPER